MNNILEIGSTSSLLIGYSCSPFLFVLIDAVLLPRLCRWVAQPFNEINHVTNRSYVTTSEIGLLMLSRLIIVVWIPLIAVMALDDGCFGMWRSFWNSCSSDSRTFDVPDPVRSDRFALTTAEVCSRSYRLGRCSRRVITLISGIHIRKLALQSTLQPVIMILAASIPWIRSRFRYVTDRYLGIGTLASAQAISWLETAIVYGYAAPTVGIFATAALWSNYLVGRYLVGHGSVVECSHGRLPIWYIPTSVLSQSVLATWVFVDNQYQGNWMVHVNLIAVWFYLSGRAAMSMIAGVDATGSHPVVEELSPLTVNPSRPNSRKKSVRFAKDLFEKVPRP